MKALPSIAFNEFSGSAGIVTARSVSGKTFLNHKAQQPKVTTASQAVRRNTLSKVSRAYKQLTDSQMKSWGLLAERMKGISTFGKAAELTAHNAFVRINSNRALAGMPMLIDAPEYKSDVPEVEYTDLWISEDMIFFTGLVVPSDSYRLVVKMSPALSPGTSNGWSKTVIVAPGIVPDWGDADVTPLYTETLGVSPEEGMKYYLECWWLDIETGFTGESMMISAICKPGSTAYNQEYAPRVTMTLDDVISNEDGAVDALDYEFSPGSILASSDIRARQVDLSSPASYFTLDLNTDDPRLDRATTYQWSRCPATGDSEGEKRYFVHFMQVRICTQRYDLGLHFANRGGLYCDIFDTFGTYCVTR